MRIGHLPTSEVSSCPRTLQRREYMLKRRRKKRRKNEKVQEIRQIGTVCGGEGTGWPRRCPEQRAKHLVLRSRSSRCVVPDEHKVGTVPQIRGQGPAGTGCDDDVVITCTAQVHCGQCIS